MDGFKDTTKTCYYSHGGPVRGAAEHSSTAAKFKHGGTAKIGKVMDEFGAGKLHSGSKRGPVVSNPKQATAIALNEARKAGAKIPKPFK